MHSEEKASLLIVILGNVRKAHKDNHCSLFQWWRREQFRLRLTSCRRKLWSPQQLIAHLDANTGSSYTRIWSAGNRTLATYKPICGPWKSCRHNRPRAYSNKTSSRLLSVKDQSSKTSLLLKKKQRLQVLSLYWNLSEIWQAPGQLRSENNLNQSEAVKLSLPQIVPSDFVIYVYSSFIKSLLGYVFFKCCLCIKLTLWGHLEYFVCVLK